MTTKNSRSTKTFNEKIWELTEKIPKGKITTYKILAHELDTNAYRAVGQALRCNPYAPRIPCHRVVSSDGSIGGFMGKIESESKEIRKKTKMLTKEGIRIKQGKIIDFENVLFRYREL